MITFISNRKSTIDSGIPGQTLGSEKVENTIQIYFVDLMYQQTIHYRINTNNASFNSSSGIKVLNVSLQNIIVYSHYSEGFLF